MFDVNIEYKKESTSEIQVATMILNAMPAVGDYIQYKDGIAFKVEKVYHIPTEIDQIKHIRDADAIIFAKLVDDLSI